MRRFVRTAAVAFAVAGVLFTTAGQAQAFCVGAGVDTTSVRICPPIE